MTSPAPEHGITPADIASAGAVPADLPGLQEAIDTAVDAIRTYCGWHVWPQRTETITIDGEGGRVLTLETLKMTDVAEIREHGNVLSAEAYEWSAGGDIKRVVGCWTHRWRGIEIDLTHGHAVVPDALRGLIVDTVADAVSNPVGAPTAIGPFQWGAQVPASSRWLSEQRAILDRYRLPEVI
ncbi:hypothetical protein [Gordonia sp. MMO-8]|uniref:hypothetical protein n=1 Tax=Gordonia sp. MMO-8 TaxID=3127886 RepID=UPI003019A557